MLTYYCRRIDLHGLYFSAIQHTLIAYARRYTYGEHTAHRLIDTPYTNDAHLRHLFLVLEAMLTELQMDACRFASEVSRATSVYSFRCRHCGYAARSHNTA